MVVALDIDGDAEMENLNRGDKGKVYTINDRPNGQRSENEEVCCCKYYKDFTANTSLHGLKFTGESERSTCERLVWLAIVLTSFCMCSFLISQVWNKWNDTPVIVSFSEKSTPIWQIPHPAVTICPIVKADRNKFDYNLVCDETKNLTEVEDGIHKVMATLCETCREEDSKFCTDSDVESFLNVSLNSIDTLEACRYASNNLPCQVVFKTIVTEEGSCFTFNMITGEEIYSDKIPRDVTFFSHTIGKGSGTWSQDEGYGDPSPTVFPIRAQAHGADSGLEVYLTQKKNITSFSCNPADNGYRIAIHPPNVIPRLQFDYFEVPLNRRAIFRIKPTMMGTSKAVKDYKPEKRLCYFGDERKLDFFKNYNQKNCEFECESKFMAELCGCVPLMMLRNASIPFCSVGSDDCVKLGFRLYGIHRIVSSSPLEAQPSEIKKKRIGIQQKLLNLIENCDCMPSCTEIGYEVTVNQAPFDKNSMIESGSDFFDQGLDYTEISVFLIESHFITSKRSELYNIFDFLANIGGLLGLCLGFSVVSLAEMFYFFVVRPIVDNIKKRR